MRPFAFSLLFSLVTIVVPALAQIPGRPISLDGRILLAADFSQTTPAPPPGYGGYYKPVAPQGRQAPCGGFGTPPCTGQTLPDNGQSGEQLFLSAKQADANHQDAQAIEYLTRSAKLGYRKAQYALGIDYQKGHGVPQDARQAKYWLDLAAQQGSTSAQQELSKTDPASAVHYLQMGAEQHDPQSEFDLGLDYELGRGVPHDRSKAMQYLRDASRYGGHSTGEQIAAALARSAPTRRFQSEQALLALVPPEPVAARHQTPAGCPAWYDSHIEASATRAVYYGQTFCIAHPNCAFTWGNGAAIVCNGEQSPLHMQD